MMKYLLAIVVIFSFSFTGCSNYKANIESDTYWSGTFGNTYMEGFGDATVYIDENYSFCCTVQKDTYGGYVEVSISDDSIFSLYDIANAITYAPYGSVTLCNR